MTRGELGPRLYRKVATRSGRPDALLVDYGNCAEASPVSSTEGADRDPAGLSGFEYNGVRAQLFRLLDKVPVFVCFVADTAFCGEGHYNFVRLRRRFPGLVNVDLVLRGALYPVVWLQGATARQYDGEGEDTCELG